MLEAAYDICINKTAKLNFKYINTILDSWHKSGYKKPSDIKEEKQENKTKNEKTPSYSMESINKKVNNFD